MPLRDPNNWLRANAVGYEYLQRPEKRVIENFLMLWSFFEAKVHDTNVNLPRMYAKVETWSNGGILEDQRSTVCWEFFRDRYGYHYSIESLMIQRPQDQEFLQACLGQANLSLPDRHKALSIITYRLRNNLMHGIKWAYGISHQKENFEHANEMLMVWIDTERIARGGVLETLSLD